MKITTIIWIFLAFSAIGVGAQTKPKSVKAVESKAKIAPAKSVVAKTANAKSKSAPKEKTAPEKSKSAASKSAAKDKPAKTANGKTPIAKTAPNKTTSAKSSPVKTPNEKSSTAKTALAKNAVTKTEPKKVDSIKKQAVKSEAPTKNSVKSSVKSPPKTNAQNIAKSAAQPKTSVKITADKPIAESTAKKRDEETPVAAIAEPDFDAGEIVGRTYTNDAFNFSVSVPDDWEIADADFAERLKKEGFNLNVEAPKAAKANAQSKLNAATNRVKVLLTAYKASPETNKNAILRVSVEDLRGVPQIKDAVDYFDSMRATYQNIKLPVNFKYSETQAEKLGSMQFGFLDTTNGAAKKRMYATVRNGFALMFTLTYASEEDLAALKKVLADGDFRRR